MPARECPRTYGAAAGRALGSSGSGVTRGRTPPQNHIVASRLQISAVQVTTQSGLVISMATSLFLATSLPCRPSRNFVEYQITTTNIARVLAARHVRMPHGVAGSHGTSPPEALWRPPSHLFAREPDGRPPRIVINPAMR